MNRSRLTDAALSISSRVAALFVCTVPVAFVGFLTIRGFPVLGRKLFFGDTSAIDAILGLRPVWDGLWPATAGTLYLLLLTMLFAIMPGVGGGVYLACYANSRQKQWLGLAVDLLAGVPSIVMGLFGFVLIVFLRRTILPDGTTCLLLASFCLALLVLPSLVVGTKNALESLPERLYLTATALGFSHDRTVFSILVPAAGKGILGGIILAMEHALTEVGLWDEVRDRLDRPAMSLSGGQQQRLCLARALALEPEILLLDEPTASLDSLAGSRIEELILSFRERYSVIMVSHSLSQARKLADVVFVMSEGRIDQRLSASEIPEGAEAERFLEKLL